jgi:hypothetical protein
MKEFDKWWCSKIGVYYKHSVENIAKDGWKAALEWAMTWEKLREPHWVFDEIKKELEDDKSV